MTRAKNNDTILRTADISNIANKDNLNNDVFIFDDIREFPLERGPFKLMLPIFAICTEGTVDISMNLTDYHITADTLVTLMPGAIIHKCSYSDDFKALFIGVRAGYSQENLSDILSILPIVTNFKSHPVIKLSSKQSHSIQEFHAHIWKKLKTAKSEFAKKSVQHLLQALLLETMDIYSTSMTLEGNKHSRYDKIFTEFVTLLEQHFRDDRSVAFYAQKLDLTPKHLSAVSKAVSGENASAIIENYVIIAAKVMLCSSKKSILDISKELNFANQAFFGKYFKQHSGLTPGEYRLKKSKGE